MDVLVPDPPLVHGPIQLAKNFGRSIITICRPVCIIHLLVLVCRLGYALKLNFGPVVDMGERPRSQTIQTSVDKTRSKRVETCIEFTNLACICCSVAAPRCRRRYPSWKNLQPS